jgi:PAS domain S-box-containing protein
MVRLEIATDITERKKAEDNLRLVKYSIDNAGEGIFWIDKEARLINVNEAACKQLGYSKDELLSLTVRDIDPGFSIEKWPEYWRELEKKGSLIYETLHMRKNGKTYPVELKVNYVKFGDREFNFTLARDVSKRKGIEDELLKYQMSLMELVNERTSQLQKTNQKLAEEIDAHKRVQEILHREKEKAQKYLDIAGVMMVVIDPDQNVTLINKKGCEILGYDENEITGKNWLDTFIPKRFRTEAKAIFKKLMAGNIKPVEYFENSVLTRNGEERIIAWHNTVLRDNKNNIISTLASGEDITIRRRVEEEALRTSQLASIGELAAGVAHEINNPINGIINYAQIIANKTARESKENEISRRIVKEGDRISHIVISLLSFARDRKEEKSPSSIYNIISDSLALTAAQLKNDGIRIHVNIASGIPEFDAQHQQIEQVFLNIISNARYALNQKYPGTRRNKKLDISAEKITKDNIPYIRTIFHDTGMGISPTVLDKVMNPFFTTKPCGMGTGLGLSISHGIISDHNGIITIDSVENEFTKIIIDLPAKTKTG